MKLGSTNPSILGYRVFWATSAIWLAVFFGSEFVENFGMGPWKERHAFPDFFQEWSSARNLFEGVPIYAPLSIPLRRYVGAPADAMGLVIINAHPPTSVLLALPFARLDFDIAFPAWNLVMLAPIAASLWIVARQLGISPTRWDVFPAIALSLLCSAVWQQVR